MVNYIEELENRGYECRSSGKNNVFIVCPFHNEAAGSCSVNTLSGGFHCFGCDASGSFVKLISEIDGIDEGSARLLLDVDADIKGLIAGINKNLFEEEDKSKRRFIPDSFFRKKFLRLGGPYYKYMEKRGISSIVCNMFDLRCGVSGKWSNRVIMPIRNIDGRIVGFQGRSILKNAYLKVRTHIAYSGALKETFFGIHTLKNWIRQEGFVILVEGPIDALSLAEYHLPVVARLGKNLLSGEQVKLLLQLVDKVLIAYDGDKSGQDALEEEYKRLRKVIPTIPIRLPVGKDPNDLTEEEIKKIFKGYLQGRR